MLISTSSFLDFFLSAPAEPGASPERILRFTLALEGDSASAFLLLDPALSLPCVASG
jgi:hypothetical protein